jgi:hypothetical protein
LSLLDKPSDFLRNLSTDQLNEIALEGVRLLQLRHSSGDTSAYSANQVHVLANQSSPPGPLGGRRQISPPHLLPPAAPAVNGRSPIRNAARAQIQVQVERFRTSLKFFPDYVANSKTLFGTDRNGHNMYVGELTNVTDDFENRIAATRAIAPDSAAEIVTAHEIMTPLIRRSRFNVRFIVASAFINYVAKSLDRFYGGVTDDDKEGLRRLVAEYHGLGNKSTATCPQIKRAYVTTGTMCDL